MRRDSYDCDGIGFGAAEPEDAVSGRSFIFSVSFEDFLAARATERLIFVRMQGRMALAGPEQAERFLDRLQSLAPPSVSCKLRQILCGAKREVEPNLHDAPVARTGVASSEFPYSISSSAYFANEPRLRSFPAAA